MDFKICKYGYMSFFARSFVVVCRLFIIIFPACVRMCVKGMYPIKHLITDKKMYETILYGFDRNLKTLATN